MAHVALIGASGRAGSPILKELSDRGHKVTAIARNPEKIAALPNVTAKKGDVFDKNGLTTLLKGHDAVVSRGTFYRQRSGNAGRGGACLGREALSGGRRRRQPRSGTGQTPCRPAGIPRRLQAISESLTVQSLPERE